MLLDQLSRRRLTAATATAHGQLHLYLAEAAGTLLDSPADLAVGDPVTQTDIHEPYALPAARQPVECLPRVIRMRMIVNYHNFGPLICCDAAWKVSCTH